MHDDFQPLYWAVRAELAPRPTPHGRHRWIDDPPTEAIPAVTGTEQAPKVYIEVSEPEDPRLNRNVVHDPAAFGYSTEREGRLAFPTKPVLHQRHCPPFDQGDLGSCVGNAGAGMMMTEPYWKPGRQWGEPDAVDLYGRATRADRIQGVYPPDDTGSSGDGLGRALRQMGLAKSWRWAFGLRQVLATLAVRPVCAGLPWYSTMMDADHTGLVTIGRSARMIGGHEIELLGVDPTTQTVRFAQSWGTGWGDSGFGVMSWSTLDRLLNEHGDVMTIEPV